MDRNSPRRPRETPSRSGLPRSRRAVSCAQQVIPIKPFSSQSCTNGAGRTGLNGDPSTVARTLGRSLGSHFVAFFALTLISRGRRSAMKAGYVDEISNWTGLEELSAAHYHAAAARARKLHAEATTPRLKQYLRKLIAKLEGLARDVQTESGFS
jgi:hypothetical protein